VIERNGEHQDAKCCCHSECSQRSPKRKDHPSVIHLESIVTDRSARESEKGAGDKR
jgi:hypothetical protein